MTTVALDDAVADDIRIAKLRHRFRILLILSAVIWLLGAYLPLSAEAQRWEGQLQERGSSSAANPLTFLLMVVFLNGYIGLFQFKRLARPMAIWSGLAILIGANLQPRPTVIVSGLSFSLYSLSYVLFGVCLALAYHSPLADVFDRPAGRRNMDL